MPKDPLAAAMSRALAKDQLLFGAAKRQIEELDEQILDLSRDIDGTPSDRVAAKTALVAARDVLVSQRDAVLPARIVFLEANSNVATVRAAVAAKQALLDQLGGVQAELLSIGAGYHPKNHPAVDRRVVLEVQRDDLLDQIAAVEIPKLQLT